MVWCVSGDTTILEVPTFLSAPACTACTDIVYSKELERDVSYNYRVGEDDIASEYFWQHSFIKYDGFYFYVLSTNKGCYVHAMCKMLFYVRSTNKGCYVHAMCKMLLFRANIGKTSAYFLRFDIKLKKSRSVFDLVTVLISKQSFFQHRIWPV